MKEKSVNILGIKNRYAHILSLISMHYQQRFHVLNIFCTFWHQNEQNMAFIFELMIRY